MEKQKNIPQCRFPEFEGEWSSIKLGEYINITSGNSPSLYKLSGEGNYPFLKVEELNNSDKYQINSRFYTDDSKNLVEKNSIIFPKRGAAILVNKIRINAVPVQMDSNLMAIKPISANLNHEFLYYVINKERLYKIADTSTIPQINNKHIEPYKLYIPRRAEQHKIASFFTAIDQKISQLKRKKTLLEQYKKGVMQKIFSQEIRFRDDNGQEFPKWEKKRLGDAVDITKGEQLNRNELRSCWDYPCLNGGIEPSGYTDKYNTDENTVTISEGGNSCGYVNLMKTKFWCGGHCYKLVPKGFNTFYMYQLLKHNEMQIMELRVGTGLPNIQRKDIMKYQLQVTTSPSEQIKIASFLSAIDDKINRTQNLIERAEVWKKGLIQKMFV